MVTRSLNLLQVIALARCKLGLEGQVSHADDGIHRGADLMAHIGQKARFGEIGRLCRLLGARQFVSPLGDQFLEMVAIIVEVRQGPHAVGDIPRRAVEELLTLDDDTADTDLDIDELTIATTEPGFEHRSTVDIGPNDGTQFI